jgi:hypothetical protein
MERRAFRGAILVAAILFLSLSWMAASRYGDARAADRNAVLVGGLHLALLRRCEELRPPGCSLQTLSQWSDAYNAAATRASELDTSWRTRAALAIAAPLAVLFGFYAIRWVVTGQTR